jgi:hypothetical protein
VKFGDPIRLFNGVDLTGYAGKTIHLQLENFPCDWSNGVYWYEVKVVSKPKA